MNRTTAPFPRLAVLLLATAVACKSADKATADQARADSAHNAAGVSAAVPELSADAKVALDSGNVLFRSGIALDGKKASADAKKAYTASLAQYRLSAQRSPQHGAPLYGIYMAAGALSDTALADSALKVMRARGLALPPGTMHSGEPSPAKAPGKAASKGL